MFYEAHIVVEVLNEFARIRHIKWNVFTALKLRGINRRCNDE